jgi:hypothetical protein
MIEDDGDGWWRLECNVFCCEGGSFLNTAGTRMDKVLHKRRHKKCDKNKLQKRWRVEAAKILCKPRRLPKKS